MKRTASLVALIAGSTMFINAVIAKDLLPNRVASGQTVRCADHARGKWCDASDNPPPAWDGTPIRGKPVAPQAQQSQAGPCSALSGNARIACQQANGVASALGKSQ